MNSGRVWPSGGRAAIGHCKTCFTFACTPESMVPSCGPKPSGFVFVPYVVHNKVSGYGIREKRKYAVVVPATQTRADIEKEVG